MNEDGLFSLIDALYQPGFDLGAAARVLGRGEPRPATAYKLELAPRNDAFRAVRLETLEPPSAGGAPYLAGIQITFQEPQPMSFPRLRAKLGEAAEQPGMKPRQDRTFKVPIQGRERDGYALLLCTLETSERDTKDVRRIILRRVPREGDAGLDVKDGVEDPNAYPDDDD